MKISPLVLLTAVAMASTAARAEDFRVTASKKLSVTAASLQAAEKKASSAMVSSDKKTLTYGAKSVRLVVRTGPEDDMMSFRIKGLRNPTLVVPAGATLSLMFVNTDEDMLHNLRLTSSKPPFPSKPGSLGSGSSDLPHGAHEKFSGQELKFKVPSKPGTYRYVCTIPGHAAAGMYGTLIVK